MNTNQSPSGPGPTRQVADLFQPVTSSAPPAGVITGQPATPLDGLNHDDELLSAPARQSGYAQGARRWASRGTGLVVGTPAAAVAVVASAALVLVLGGMTMFITSSSTELPVAGLALSRLPAPAMPAISDEHPVTVAPIDAPAGFAQPAPAKAYSPDAPPSPTHQQPVLAAHRALPAPAAPPPAPDHGPVSSSPRSSPPPSTVTTEDAGYKNHNQGDRQSNIDRQRELRAQGAEHRSRSRAQGAALREQAKQHRQAARQDAKTGPRPSPSRDS